MQGDAPGLIMNASHRDALAMMAAADRVKRDAIPVFDDPVTNRGMDEQGSSPGAAVIRASSSFFPRDEFSSGLGSAKAKGVTVKEEKGK